MSQRAKASAMCQAAGYARGGFARPARGPKRPPSSKTMAAPTQMPADMMAAPPAAPAAPQDPAMQAPMKRGGMARKGRDSDHDNDMDAPMKRGGMARKGY